MARKTRSKKQDKDKDKPDETPVKPDGLALAVRGVFSATQEDDVPIAKAVSQFRKIWDRCSVDPDEAPERRRRFFDAFIRYLRLPLIFQPRNEYVDRCLKTCCKFAASFFQELKDNKEKVDDDEPLELPEFMEWFLNWLLDHHGVQGSQARLRICLMVNHLMKLMGEDACIDDVLYQKIFENMMERLKDKVADIRSQAVTALQRLQDPRDPECPIIKAFLFHMSMDPSASVRLCVVQVIGATRITLPHILRRTKDTDENVRKAAFKFIADKIHIRSFSIAQREQVMERGLRDRTDSVKRVMERDLIPAWLHLCKDNVVELLYALDVSNSSNDGRIASDVLQVFFRSLPPQELVAGMKYIDANRLVPFEKLTPEVALYWNKLAFFLASEGGSVAELVEKILPELTEYCRYLRHYILEIERPSGGSNSGADQEDDDDEMAWEFVAKRLIEIATIFDLADEVGRRNLLQLCKDLLASSKVTSAFVEPLMSLFTTLRTDRDARVSEVAEIIAELKDPIKVEHEECGSDATDLIQETPGAAKCVRSTSSVRKTPQQMLELDEENRKKQLALADLRMKVMQLKDDLDAAVKNKDFLKAQELQVNLEALEEEQKSLHEELTAAAAIASRPDKEASWIDLSDKDDDDEVKGQSTISQRCAPTNPLVLHKCLEMLFQLMQDPQIKTLNATLMSLLEEFIMPSIAHLEAEIRKVAVQALTVFSLRSIEVARQNLPLLFQMGRLDETPVRLKALAMVNDLLIHYGLKGFIKDVEDAEEPNNEEEQEWADIEAALGIEHDNASVSGNVDGGGGYKLTQQGLNAQGGNLVVAFLVPLLNDPDGEVRSKVVEGMCKLLMSGVISSPKLLQRLILMWYNPAVADEEGKMRHILGTFFPLFASISRDNQDSLEEAFIPTLRTLSKAPVTSPLACIDAEDVGLFLVQLTRPDFLQAKDLQGSTVHDSLAFRLGNEILSDPDCRDAKIMIKLLLSLQLSSGDFVKLRELAQLTRRLKSVIKETLPLKAINKLEADLAMKLSEDPTNEAHTDDTEEPNKDTTATDETTMNCTNAISKRRVLFSQSNTTILTPCPDRRSRSSGVLAEKTLSEVESVTASPICIKLHANKTTEIEVTRVEETSDEEELLVSGNMRKVEKSVRRTDVASASPVTSTQRSSNSDESQDSAEPCSVESFFGRPLGNKARKMRKKESTTEEEDNEDSQKVSEASKLARKTGRRRGPARQAKRSAKDDDV